MIRSLAETESIKKSRKYELMLQSFDYLNVLEIITRRANVWFFLTPSDRMTEQILIINPHLEVTDNADSVARRMWTQHFYSVAMIDHPS